MNILSLILLIFALLGALDRIFGSKLGLGQEFEKGFMVLGPMALSMIGMISLAPVIANLLGSIFDGFYNLFKIDPSIIPSAIFANDMGAASVSKAIAKDPAIAMFNGLVVSSMMGCTFSFIIPFALGVTEKKHHKDMFLGLLCGIATIPIGCIVAGLMLKIKLGTLILNLLPIILLSCLIAAGLLFASNLTVKAFLYLGYAIKILITIGLALSIIQFVTNKTIVKDLAPISEGTMLCLNCSVVLCGAFPLIAVVSKIFARPIKKLGEILKINEQAVQGLVATPVTGTPTMQMLNGMDSRGIILNSALLTSAAFTFGSHFAFTQAFNPNYILPVIIGKLISGACALTAAILITKNNKNNQTGMFT